MPGTDTPLMALAAALDAALPQTQCTRCGYPDCRAYAQAMAAGEADINRCPPGGAEGVQRLAALVGRPPPPLDSTRGREGPRALARILNTEALPYDRSRGIHKPASIALVIEADCIGCTKCIQACPVDAIVGGAKHMHVVIEPLCTGCELCLPACPVDCIEMLAVS